MQAAVISVSFFVLKETLDTHGIQFSSVWIKTDSNAEIPSNQLGKMFEGRTAVKTSVFSLKPISLKLTTF